MKFVLALCIPAVWLWGITLAVIVREYFGSVLYQDFSLFITGATLLFPMIALAVTVVLVHTIKAIR
tara:strand:- start:1438 stop:1635 length:198 start_codon:yes stop_codon:yes gene_type:complete